MKKLFSIVLSVLLLLPIVTSFGLGSAAESTYEELWAEKVAYESKYPVGTGMGDGRVFSKYTIWPTILLYSEIADQFTFEIAYVDAGEESVISSGPYVWGFNEYKGVMQKVLYCPQLDGGGSWHDGRAAIRSLGLTKEQIVAAYQKMENEPEFIRDMLSYLSDSEFEQLVNMIRYDHSLTKLPENFMLEALTMEDEIWAKRLLCKAGAVYLPEYDKIYSTFELFGDAAVSFEPDFDGFFDGVDLTTREFQYYFQNLKRHVYEESPGYDEYMYGTVLPKMVYLETEMEKQMTAKETGDASVVSLCIVLLTAPMMIGMIVTKKKRKI